MANGRVEMISHEENVGKQGARLDIGCHVSPGIRIVLRDGANLPAEFAERLRDKIVELVDRELCPFAAEWSWSNSEKIDVRVEQYTIQSWRETWDAIKPDPEKVAAAEAARNRALDEHPNNGTYGLWIVEGIRHEATVDARTAREALERALADGDVGDWESPTVTFKKPLKVH